MLSHTIKLAASVSGPGTPFGWIARLGGSNNDSGDDIILDSSGNVYVTGITSSQGAGGNDVVIAKYDNDGVIQWQRSIGTSGGQAGTGICLDGSNNIYVSLTDDSAGAVVKCNSSGVIQWQRKLTATTNVVFQDITIDGSNLRVVGSANGTGYGTASSDDPLTVNYDASGTVAWARWQGSTYSFERAYDVAVDGSSNTYVCGQEYAASSTAYVTKYDSTPSIAWSKKFSRSSGGTSARGICTDGTSTYFCGSYANGLFVVKLTSGGTIAWQRFLYSTTTGQQASGSSIALDSLGDVYVCGTLEKSGSALVPKDGLIAKYNSSGTLQWQRKLVGGASTEDLLGITVDNNGYFYLVGTANNSTAGGSDLMIAKLPTNGAGTGVHGNYTYSTTTLTSGTGNLTIANTAMSNGTAGGLTESTPSFSEAATTLTSTTIY